MRPSFKPFLVLTAVMFLLVMSMFAVALLTGNLKGADREFLGDYPATEKTSLDVRNHVGKISISTWDGGNINVHGNVHSIFGEDELDKVKIEVTPGENFDVTVDADPNLFWITVDLTIKVPDGVTLGLIQSDIGIMRVENTAGNSTFKNDLGEIRIKNHDGSINVEAKAGSILIQDVPVVNTVSTEAGSIKLEDVGTVKSVRSEAGEITVKISSVHPEGTKISGESVDIIVFIPETTSCNFTMLVNEGSCKIYGLDPTLDVELDQYKSGTIGGGGPLLDMEAEAGSIELHGRKV